MDFENYQGIFREQSCRVFFLFDLLLLYHNAPGYGQVYGELYCFMQDRLCERLTATFRSSNSTLQHPTGQSKCLLFPHLSDGFQFPGLVFFRRLSLFSRSETMKERIGTKDAIFCTNPRTVGGPRSEIDKLPITIARTTGDFPGNRPGDSSLCTEKGPMIELEPSLVQV